MEPLPKKTSLTYETAQTLKQWITSGVLHEILPGELELKKRLAVGRDTLRRALKLLEHQRWIAPSSKGKQRRIQVGRVKEQSLSVGQLPVTFFSPNKVEHRITLMELEETQLRLARAGRALRFISHDLFHLKHPEHRLQQLVKATPSSAWILWLVSEPIQRWFDRQNVPVFLMGSPFPGVNLPYIVNDWGPAAFHAGLQLVRQGHRKVALLEYHERFPGLIAEEKGLARALQTVSPEGEMVTLFDDGTPKGIAHSLETIFAMREKPTAVALTRVQQVLTCFSWFVSKGIQVPGDMSVISLANDSFFEDFYPPVSHYRSNTKLFSRSIAQRISELLESGRITKKSLRIPLEYCPGATVGPAVLR